MSRKNETKALAVLLALASLVPNVRADVSEADLARQLRVYVYRPGVFADEPLGVGIPADRRPLGNRPWYVQINQSVHSLLRIEALARFLRAAQIPGLDFTNDQVLSTGEMARLLEPALEGLRLLKIPGTFLDDQILPTIGNLYSLEVLELNDRVTDRGVAFLKNLRHLKSLTLSGAKVTDQSMDTAAVFSQLEWLNLKGTSVTDAGIRKLVGLSLHELDLGALSTDQSLESAGTMSSLRQLDGSQARITRMGLSALAGADGLHTLFLGASITDSDLPSLLKFKNLKRLDLTGSKITDRSADILAQMTPLEELALTGTQVTARTLEKLRLLSALRYLEISDTSIGAAELRSIKPFPAIQVISFSSRRRVTADDVQSLARWPRLHSILINGVLLGPDLVGHLKKRRSTRAWPRFVTEAEAAGASDADVERVLEVASAPTLQEKSTRRFEGFSGLKRIHESEASLEDVAAAPSNPMADTFQENEKNFLGEITVNAVSQKKKSTKH